MLTKTDIILLKVTLPTVVLLTQLGTSSILVNASCGITFAASHKHRTTGNSSLDVNNRRRSSRCIEVSKHLAGIPMSDKRPNKRPGEDIPATGVGISQRDTRKNPTTKTQTRPREAVLIEFGQRVFNCCEKVSWKKKKTN